jgi:hypothetical protein
MSKNLTVLAAFAVTLWVAPKAVRQNEANIVKEDLERPAAEIAASTATFAGAPVGAWLPAVREISYSRNDER